MSKLKRSSVFEDKQSAPTSSADPLTDLGTRFPLTNNKLTDVDLTEIREFSEQQGFPSREPDGRKKNRRPKVRARRALPQTGRNEQFNLKVHPGVKERFYDIADDQRWGLGETLEHALDALERQLIEGRQARTG